MFTKEEVLALFAFGYERMPMFVVYTPTLSVSIHHPLQQMWFAAINFKLKEAIVDSARWLNLARSSDHCPRKGTLNLGV